MKVLVIGSTNVDYIGTTPYELEVGGSHPGIINISAGGVARNITENLARCGADVTFISAIANDSYGIKFKNDLENLGVKVVTPNNINNYPTSTYFAINNNKGVLEYAIVNTDIIKLLSIDYFKDMIDQINTYDYVVFDSNLDIEVLDYLFENITSPIICDAVSIIKVKKYINHLDKIFLLKLNNDEYITMKQYLNHKMPKHLVVTAGSDDLTYITSNNKTLFKVEKVDNIVDTNGVGDALISGIIRVLLENESIEKGIKFGLKLASITLHSKSAVSIDIPKYEKDKF